MFQKVVAFFMMTLCIAGLCTLCAHLYSNYGQGDMGPGISMSCVCIFGWAVGLAIFYKWHPPYPGTIEDLSEGAIYIRMGEMAIDQNTRIVVLRDHQWRLLCIRLQKQLTPSPSAIYIRKGEELSIPTPADEK